MSAQTRPTFRFQDLTVVADKAGREVALIPDGVAAAMRDEIRSSWFEYRGLACGSSALFLPGSWMYDTTRLLIAAYAASPIPAGISDHDRRRAEIDRGAATAGWHLYAIVCGVSAWDLDAGWWVDYEKYRHLCVPGCAQLRPPGYRWEG